MGSPDEVSMRPRPDYEGPPYAHDELAWHGRIVRDERGETIGRIEKILVDDATGAADWALVCSNDPWVAPAFVPLLGSRREGEDVIVAVAKSQCTDAPRTQEASRLSDDQGAALYRHYGIDEADQRAGELRLGGLGQRLIAGEQRLASQISRFWLRRSSVMRGDDETVPVVTTAKENVLASPERPESP
jgi:hypothetical protein